jgi:hypothetical protein
MVWRASEAFSRGGAAALKTRGVCVRRVGIGWAGRVTARFVSVEGGADNVMFQTAFPLPTRLYPEGNIDVAPNGLTEAEKAKVLSGNAARECNITPQRPCKAPEVGRVLRCGSFFMSGFRLSRWV